VTVNLDRYYYPVDSVGVSATGADSVNSVDLRNVDGIILMKITEDAEETAQTSVKGGNFSGVVIQ